MSEETGVLIVGEIENGGISPTSKELFHAGGQLASGLGQPLVAALLDKDESDCALEAVAYGARKVFRVVHPLLDGSNVEAYVAALEQVCRHVKPSVLLIARSQLGRELGPRLAFRLGVGCAQDAVGLSLDPSSRQLLVTRPVYGGGAMAVVRIAGKPQIATVRPKVFASAARDESLRGEVVKIPVEIDASIVKARLIQKVSSESVGLKLEDARVVIGGGRGVDGPEGFRELEKVAHLLGGAFGASRPACDAGWVEHSYQIGLTGKTVTPDLYIAVAISGASQHMAGCSGAKVIVAINSDTEANIFKEARYGVVGDWRKVVPAFTAAVRELLN